MSSERRIRASRANGAKSRGPKTPESKARSAANNLRHGLLSRAIVLEDENFQSFTDLLTTLEARLHPQNEIQRALVEKMAAGRWRLLRLWAIERDTLTAEMHKLDPAAKESNMPAAFRALGDGFRSLDLLGRYEARLDRQYAKSLTLLLKMGKTSSPAARTESVFCHSNLVPNSDTGAPPIASTPPVNNS